MSQFWKKIGKQETNQKQPIQLKQQVDSQTQQIEGIVRQKKMKESTSNNNDSRKASQQYDNLSYSGDSIQILEFLNKSKEASIKDQNGKRSFCIDLQIQYNSSSSASVNLNEQLIKKNVKKQSQTESKKIRSSSQIQIFMHQMKNLAINSNSIVQAQQQNYQTQKLNTFQPSQIIQNKKFMMDSDSISEGFQGQNQQKNKSVNHVKSFIRLNKKLGRSSQNSFNSKNSGNANIIDNQYPNNADKIVSICIKNSKIVQSQGDSIHQSAGQNSQVLQQISLRPTEQYMDSGNSAANYNLSSQQLKKTNKQQSAKYKKQGNDFQQNDTNNAFDNRFNKKVDNITKSDIINREAIKQQDLQIRYSNRSNCNPYQNQAIAQQKQSNQESVSIVSQNISGQNAKVKKFKIQLNIKKKQKNQYPVSTYINKNSQKPKDIQKREKPQQIQQLNQGEPIQKTINQYTIMKVSEAVISKKFNLDPQILNQNGYHPQMNKNSQYVSQTESVQEIQLTPGNILTLKQNKNQSQDASDSKDLSIMNKIDSSFKGQKISDNPSLKKNNSIQKNKSSLILQTKKIMSAQNQIQSPLIIKYISLKKNNTAQNLQKQNIKQNVHNQIYKMSEDYNQNTQLSIKDIEKWQSVYQKQYKKLKSQNQKKSQEIYFYKKQLQKYKLKVQSFLEQIQIMEDQKCNLQEQLKQVKQCLHNYSPEFYKDFSIQNQELKQKINQLSNYVKSLQTQRANISNMSQKRPKLISQSAKIGDKRSSSNMVSMTGCFNLSEHNQSSSGKISIQSRVQNLFKNFECRQQLSLKRPQLNANKSKKPISDSQGVTRQLFPSQPIEIAFPVKTQINIASQQGFMQIQEYIFDLQQKIVSINIQIQQKSRVICKTLQAQIQTKFKIKYRQTIQSMKQELKKIKKKYDKLKEYIQRQMTSQSQQNQSIQFIKKKAKCSSKKYQFSQMQSFMNNVEGFQKFINFMNMFNQMNSFQNTTTLNNANIKNNLRQTNEPSFQNHFQSQDVNLNKKQAVSQIFGIKQNQKNIQKLYGTLQNQWKLIQQQKIQFFNQKDKQKYSKQQKNEWFSSNTSIKPKTQFKKFTSQVNQQPYEHKYNAINQSRSERQLYMAEPKDNLYNYRRPTNQNNYNQNQFQSHEDKQTLKRRISPNYHLNYGRQLDSQLMSPQKKYQMRSTKPYSQQQEFSGLSSKLNKLRSNLNQQLNSIK